MYSLSVDGVSPSVDCTLKGLCVRLVKMVRGWASVSAFLLS